MTDEPRDHSAAAPDDPGQAFADIQSEVENIDLHSSLRGYSPPPAGAPEHVREQRLCPGCGGIRDFIDGVCQNCGFKPGTPVESGADVYAAADAYPAGMGGAQKALLIALAVLALGVIGYFVWPLVAGDGDRRSTDAQTATGGSVSTADPATPGEATGQGSGHTGALEQVVFDDSFHTRATVALRGGNKAWSDAGLDAYVYRYSIGEIIVPATSQDITITAFAGGKDATTAISGEHAEAYKEGVRSFMAELTGHDGVRADLQLRATDGEESPAESDRYIVYGYYYGREHMDSLAPIISALEDYKSSQGQYPLELDESMAAHMPSKGNPNFTAGGVGYVPVFATDGSGSIRMGSGGTIARLTPAEVRGYYLLLFLRDPSAGLDFYSPADLQYYTNKISPFPYQPDSPVRNMPLTIDGKPDGVGAVVKDGKLMQLP